MNKLIGLGLSALLLTPFLFAVETVTAVHGTISRIDKTAKTIVVKTADGTEQTFRFVGKTAVHGTEAGAKDTFHGLTEGSEVVAHYTTKGADKTAVEVDKVGKDGLKTANGTVSEVDNGGKTLVVKTSDGTQQSFKVAGHAAQETGAGVKKSAKVTVYYTEDAGKKVVHWFQNN